MIKITPEQRDDCYRFAKLIVDNDIIYDRFNYTKEQRIQKLAFGKLGEVAFYNYLTAHNIKVEYPAIFSLLGADKYDFKMDNGDYTIDVKSIEANHQYILQPKSQSLKDFIVGVRICGNMADILGYINRIDFSNHTDEYVSKKMKISCYNCKVDQLKNIQIIIKNWYF